MRLVSGADRVVRHNCIRCVIIIRISIGIIIVIRRLFFFLNVIITILLQSFLTYILGEISRHHSYQDGGILLAILLV